MNKTFIYSLTLIMLACLLIPFLRNSGDVSIDTSTFNCGNEQCDYKYTLRNNSDSEQSGTVVIYLKYLPLSKSGSKDIGVIKKEFILAPNTAQSFIGSYESPKHLEAYFRIYNKKI